MLTLRITAPFASFRRSFARSFAETYPLAPPATVYGMLLSLIGEWSRARHVGVRLAFAYAREPRVATTLRKLSRYKYGVVAKQSKLGNAPDFVETLCGLDFLCSIDSSREELTRASLEARVHEALEHPERISRTGVVCLGASDDAVDDVAIVTSASGVWRRLRLDPAGAMELPVWVDHVGSRFTRWQRFTLDEPGTLENMAPEDFVSIEDPRESLRCGPDDEAQAVSGALGGEAFGHYEQPAAGL